MTNMHKFPDMLKNFSYRYFFYGMCTEDQITKFIKDAENKGCEFVTLIPGMIPTPKSALSLSAHKQPEFIPVLRVFVRCPESAWSEIERAMKAEAGHK
jgi:hypothetical protein